MCSRKIVASTKIDAIFPEREREVCHNPHDTYDTQTITKWLESALNQLFLGAHQRNSGCRPTVDNRGGRLKCLSGPGWKRAGVYKRRFVSAVSRRQITESRRRDAVEFAAFGAQASGNRRGHRLEKDGIAVVPRRSEPIRLPAHPSIHLLLAISTGLSTLYHPTFYVYSWGGRVCVVSIHFSIDSNDRVQSLSGFL